MTTNQQIRRGEEDRDRAKAMVIVIIREGTETSKIGHPSDSGGKSTSDGGGGVIFGNQQHQSGDKSGGDKSRRGAWYQQIVRWRNLWRYQLSLPLSTLFLHLGW